MRRQGFNTWAGLGIAFALAFLVAAVVAWPRRQAPRRAATVAALVMPAATGTIKLPAGSPKVVIGRKQEGHPLAGPAPVTVEGTTGWRFAAGGNHPLATPAVAHGRVYFGGGYGSHEFYALDAATGQLAWQIRTDDDGPSAAIVEGDSVVFNTESCTIYTVNAATGRTRWKKWLGDPLMNQPAAWDGKVYMAYPDRSNQHRLTCMALGDGRELWNRPIRGDLITAPVLDNGTAYLTALEGTVYAFDARRGRQLWERKQNATSAPWVHQGQIYVSQREVGDRVPRLSHRGGAAPRPGPGAGGSVPGESVVMMGGASGEVKGKQAPRAGARYLTRSYNDGQTKYQASKAQDSGVGFATAPAAAKLGQSSENFGLATVADVWAFQGSRPCVYQGRLYTAQHDVLKCTDAESGRSLWAARFTDTKRFQGGRALLPPALAGGAVYLATATGQLICLDAATGRVRWHVEVGEPISFQPAVMSGRIYLATDKGSVFNLDARDPNATGWAMWGGNARHNL